MHRTAVFILLVLAACARGGTPVTSSPLALGSSPPATRPSKNAIRPPPTTETVIGISALQRGAQIHKLSYSGRWEFVSNRRDGRYEGASARSYHVGDSVTLVFEGNHLRIYGVTGPNGGSGTILIAGQPARALSFYSPAKVTHRLVFDSGKLKGDLQSAGLVVTAPGGGRRTGYVNIDEVEVLATK